MFSPCALLIPVSFMLFALPNNNAEWGCSFLVGHPTENPELAPGEKPPLPPKPASPSPPLLAAFMSARPFTAVGRLNSDPTATITAATNQQHALELRYECYPSIGQRLRH
jgi:hypothetical protein